MMSFLFVYLIIYINIIFGYFRVCRDGDCIFDDESIPSLTSNDIIICTNNVNLCHIKCHNKDQCKDGITVYSGAKNTLIDCFGADSCISSNIFCGEYTPVSYNFDEFNGEHNQCNIKCFGHASCKNININIKGDFINGVMIQTNNDFGIDKLSLSNIYCNINENQNCLLYCNSRENCYKTNFKCDGGLCMCSSYYCPEIIVNTFSPTNSNNPTIMPTPIPSIKPTTIKPTKTTEAPVVIPTINPTEIPTESPMIHVIVLANDGPSSDVQSNIIGTIYYGLIIIIIIFTFCLICACLYFKTRLLNLTILKKNTELKQLKSEMHSMKYGYGLVTSNPSNPSNINNNNSRTGNNISSSYQNTSQQFVSVSSIDNNTNNINNKQLKHINSNNNTTINNNNINNISRQYTTSHNINKHINMHSNNSYNESIDHWKLGETKIVNTHDLIIDAEFESKSNITSPTPTKSFINYHTKSNNVNNSNIVGTTPDGNIITQTIIENLMDDNLCEDTIPPSFHGANTEIDNETVPPDFNQQSIIQSIPPSIAKPSTFIEQQSTGIPPTFIDENNSSSSSILSSLDDTNSDKIQIRLLHHNINHNNNNTH